jgi:hypothetical protein
MSEQMAMKLDALEAAEDLHVEEVTEDGTDLVTSLKWSTKTGRGSFLLDEPYRNPKTVTELQKLARKYLNLPRK